MIARRRFALAAILIAVGLAAPAHAEETWPTRPVKIIVTYVPGGSADTLGRLAAQKLSAAFGQQFVVENRPGAGGLIGCQIAARAAPDGYTLVVTSLTSNVINPATMDATTWPLDTFKDFSHIALLGGPPTVLVVDSQFPAATLAEFIAVAKATPTGLSYGSAGLGSGGALVGEMFQKLAGFHMTHVPYKGANQALADIMGHQLPVGSLTLATTGEQIHGGLMRALAVTTRRRVADYPDLPTFAELGYPDLTSTAWFSLSGPAGLPAELVQRINAAVVKGFQEPDVQARLTHDAIEFEPYSPADFVDFIKAETTRWGPVARASDPK